MFYNTHNGRPFTYPPVSRLLKRGNTDGKVGANDRCCRLTVAITDGAPRRSDAMEKTAWSA